MPGQRKAALRAATIGIGVALLASGCRTDREVTTPEPVPVTEELLTDALLTVDDLPSAYTAAEGAAIDTDVVAEHECDDALQDLEAKSQTTSGFTSASTVLTSTVAFFPGQGSQVEQLFRDVAADCEEVVVIEEGVSIRTGPLDFGVLSEDTLAIKIELEADDSSIEERDVILMRDGDLVSIVRLDGPRPSDKELLDSVVRSQIGRLGRLAQLTA